MALQVVSPAVSVYKVTGVKDGVEQTEEYTFGRGELLPDWVTPYQQFVLSQTGMARQVGDFPDPNLRRAQEEPAPVLMPEHSPLAVIGTPVTGAMEVTERHTAPAAAAPASSAPAGELPSDDDNKPVWEDFAVSRLGMKRGEAEGMRKADLIKEVKSQYADQASGEGKLPRSFGPKADAPAEEPKAEVSKAEAVTTQSRTDSTTTVKPAAGNRAGSK